jgi:hypothetical protein
MLLFLACAKLTTAQFVHVQGSASGGGSTTTATSISDPLTKAPSANHLLVFWMFLLSSDGVTPITKVSVSDSHGHAFTLTPISAAN